MCSLYLIIPGDQVKGDEIGRTCSKHGRDEKHMKDFSHKT
jgi:hypothetical protein